LEQSQRSNVLSTRTPSNSQRILPSHSVGIEGIAKAPIRQPDKIVEKAFIGRNCLFQFSAWLELFLIFFQSEIACLIGFASLCSRPEFHLPILMTHITRALLTDNMEYLQTIPLQEKMDISLLPPAYVVEILGKNCWWKEAPTSNVAHLPVSQDFLRDLFEMVTFSKLVWELHLHLLFISHHRFRKHWNRRDQDGCLQSRSKQECRSWPRFVAESPNTVQQIGLICHRNTERS
jgi:hypothetical protein